MVIEDNYKHLKLSEALLIANEDLSIGVSYAIDLLEHAGCDIKPWNDFISRANENVFDDDELLIDARDETYRELGPYNNKILYLAYDILSDHNREYANYLIDKLQQLGL